MPPSFQRALGLIGQRQDLVLVSMIVIAIMMMILPLPTWMVDALIALNMAFTVLLLMIAVYLTKPSDLPVLPFIILIATIFRLALSITTTRLILIQADAGHIVETFGRFVVAGNIVVGLVIFLIITVVQFVVITKGAERVAEVGARFSLDALPGKQMSIDAELRSGDISPQEARSKRQALERDSQLYGAMDGAMKFVKGDAIAGLIIIFINLLGGIAVGVMQLGFSFDEAVEIYSMLTVGDGLIAQIPALFVSIAAGAVVTRVASEENGSLGQDVATHLLKNLPALEVTAVVVLLLGLVPGFPSLIFVIISAGFGGMALLRRLRDRAERRAAGVVEQPANAPVAVRVAPSLMEQLPQDELTAAARATVARMEEELGLPLPKVAVLPTPTLPEGALEIEVEEVPVVRAEILPPQAEQPAPEDAETALERLDGLLEGAIRRHLTLLVGLEETGQVLERARSGHANLVEEALRQFPVQRFCLLFRQMLADGLTLRHHRVILETVIERAGEEIDIATLADHVRVGLRRQLTHAHTSPDGRVHAILLEPALEDTMRKAIRPAPKAPALLLSPALGNMVVTKLTEGLGRSEEDARPVVVTSFDLRRHLKGLLARNDRPVPVLAFEDLTADADVVHIAVIGLEPSGADPTRGSQKSAVFQEAPAQ